MKIKTNIVLKTIDGKENIKDGDKNLTIGNILSFILATTKSSNPYKSYLLAKKFHDKEVELSPEDIVFIKEVLPNFEGAIPLVLGQIEEIITK